MDSRVLTFLKGIKSGNVGVVERLLKEDFRIDTCIEKFDGWFNYTPLGIACCGDNNENALKIVDIICKSKKVDINFGGINQNGELSALWLACNWKKVERVRVLLKQPGIDVNRESKTPLERAIKMGHRDLVLEFLKDPRAYVTLRCFRKDICRTSYMDYALKSHLVLMQEEFFDLEIDVDDLEERASSTNPFTKSFGGAKARHNRGMEFVKVKFDYEARDKDRELSVKEGDVLERVKKRGEEPMRRKTSSLGWILVRTRNTKRTGWVPEEFVEYTSVCEMKKRINV